MRYLAAYALLSASLLSAFAVAQQVPQQPWLGSEYGEITLDEVEIDFQPVYGKQPPVAAVFRGVFDGREFDFFYNFMPHMPKKQPIPGSLETLEGNDGNSLLFATRDPQIMVYSYITSPWDDVALQNIGNLSSEKANSLDKAIGEWYQGLRLQGTLNFRLFYQDGEEILYTGEIEIPSDQFEQIPDSSAYRLGQDHVPLRPKLYPYEPSNRGLSQ